MIWLNLTNYTSQRIVLYCITLYYVISYYIILYYIILLYFILLNFLLFGCIGWYCIGVSHLASSVEKNWKWNSDCNETSWALFALFTRWEGIGGKDGNWMDGCKDDKGLDGWMEKRRWREKERLRETDLDNG